MSALTLAQAFSATVVREAMRAAGEETRLRILLLLDELDLTVSDLVRILGQSQPRISRHIKVLVDAGLVERQREGGWILLRLAREGPVTLVRPALSATHADDPERRADLDGLAQLKAERHRRAQAYFDACAASWDLERRLHVDEARVEAAMRDLVGPGPFALAVDLGTGTGRVLELFADLVAEGIGIDANADMLGYARDRLSETGLRHIRVQRGDLHKQPRLRGQAELVIMHQVLHFLSDPAGAIRAAATLLAPGGRLLIADFAPHDHEELRVRCRHARLGFSQEEMKCWLLDAGLFPLRTRDLPPDGACGQSLTVSLWLADQSTDATAAYLMNRPKGD